MRKKIVAEYLRSCLNAIPVFTTLLGLQACGEETEQHDLASLVQIAEPEAMSALEQLSGRYDLTVDPHSKTESWARSALSEPAWVTLDELGQSSVTGESGGVNLLLAATRQPAEKPEDVFARITQLDSDEQVKEFGATPEIPRTKVRNGVAIDYDQGAGNSSVFIAAQTAKGIEYCTAQVLNHRILLTAAHCVVALFVNGVSSQLAVAFTNRAGNLVTVYNGAALGLVEPNWRPNDKDSGLILTGGANTCQSTLTWCKNNIPDIPVNAVFQTFWRPDPEFSSLNIVPGYGTTDAVNGAGVLRWGVMQTLAAGYTDSNNGFSHIITWTNNNQVRSCKGDSGGALVSGALNDRVFHTGFASQGTPCAQTTGWLTYSGTTNAQASWILQQVLSFRDLLGLQFDCTVNFGSPSWFACDNTGAVY